ncbi:hypothetical protein GWI33_000121 [Rhynchophorus ferrugineus]|uniref:Carboxypeptidase n=1 Tax=Rhynchophorus ferrugineus TaxID=354439 RepID=A0A834IYV7_RHYFE|nr:hypothetical protein GWI33_000121 [Rhynchophorus ferrugineus]
MKLSIKYKCFQLVCNENTTTFCCHLGFPTEQRLVLTSYLQTNRLKEAREAAEVHLDAFKDVVSYSGYFNVNKRNNASLFFWFFPSANDYLNDPVVLWLQGGPGASSLYGLFVENGPFYVEENGSVTLREYSWHKNQSVIYIDQPVGTGFSYTEDLYVTNQTQVGAHLYDALTQFFTLFPELQKNEFFISGESYAGKYIPAIGYTILKNNPSADLKINLQGLLIGNGLSDPINQVFYSNLLYQLGLADKKNVEAYNSYQSQIIENINNGLYNQAVNIFNELFSYYTESTGLNNVYNYLKQEDDDPVAWEDFLNTREVRQALHVGNEFFSSQSFFVYLELSTDMMQSVSPWYLDFSAAEEYQKAPRYPWLVNDNVAGFVKVAGNLTEVMVRDAGHMVPTDQPENAYQLLYKFIRGIPLA